MLSRRALITLLGGRQCIRFMSPPVLIKKFPSRTFMNMPKPDQRLQAAVMVIAPITCFALGVWQVKRLFWKKNLISELQHTIGQDPFRFDLVKPETDLAETMEKLPEYRRVRVRGRFDHTREIYVRPRPLVDRSGKAAGASGAYVITPFILTSSTYPQNVRGTWILVNRGWVDFSKMDPTARPQGQVDAELEFIGVVRKSEPKMSKVVSSGLADDKNVVWAQRNVEAMSSVLGTAPLFIDADASSTIPGGPVGGQTIMSVRNAHLSYIFTWWTLSAATAFIWWRTYIKPYP